MLLYTATSCPASPASWSIGYHGYRTTGHRMVAVALGKDGRPTGTPTELVTDWEQTRRRPPAGLAGGLAETGDGSV